MTKAPAQHLRLFHDGDTATATAERPLAPVDRIDRLCRAFSSAVGRPLEYVAGGDSRRLQLRDELLEDVSHPAPLTNAAELAAALGDVVAELMRTQRALREREAELAAGIPLAAHAKPQRHLVERLEAVLRAAAEAIGCRAAAVYLLDDATTELKLRAAWGLPEDRLLEPARPLRGAQADLEALAGHAVALEDATLFPHWNLPEPSYAAAVCVPIATPTELLGTLWVFADTKRAFSDHEVNLVEISSGRVASDLERELLMTETQKKVSYERSWDDAVQHRRVREPQVAPLVDGWEIAGSMQSPDEALGEFYDWLVPTDGVVATAVGRVEEQGFAAALSIESLRSAWRAHVHHERDFGRLLERVNDDLWSAAVEPVPAHLLGLRMEADGTVRWAASGTTATLWLPSDEANSVRLREGASLIMPETWQARGEQLGVNPDFIPATGTRRLLLGERLLIANDLELLEHIAGLLARTRHDGTSSGNCRKWLSMLLGQLQHSGAVSTVGPLVVVRRTR